LTNGGFWGKSGKQCHNSHLAVLVLAGIATTHSSLFTFRALKLGDASLVSSLQRLSLVFAVLFLKERPNWQIILGVVLMIEGAMPKGISQQSAE
jgi:bacterial/archaeal transporter family protein